MKHLQIHVILLLTCITSFAQDPTTVKGTVIDVSTDLPIDRVNIVNLNQVIGTSTDDNGEFEIRAEVNDTLHFSYLGYKSIKVRVTND